MTRWHLGHTLGAGAIDADDSKERCPLTPQTAIERTTLLV